MREFRRNSGVENGRVWELVDMFWGRCPSVGMGFPMFGEEMGVNG